MQIFALKYCFRHQTRPKEQKRDKLRAIRELFEEFNENPSFPCCYKTVTTNSVQQQQTDPLIKQCKGATESYVNC